jgi:hypothetical protein
MGACKLFPNPKPLLLNEKASFPLHLRVYHDRSGSGKRLPWVAERNKSYDGTSGTISEWYDYKLGRGAS